MVAEKVAGLMNFGLRRLDPEAALAKVFSVSPWMIRQKLREAWWPVLWECSEVDRCWRRC